MGYLGLSMADSAHEEGHISLDIGWELLHGNEVLGSGGYFDGTINLEV